MASADVRACARSARVVVLVLIGSALVGLCLPHVSGLALVPERYSQISFKALVPFRDVQSGISKAGFDNASPSSIRSTEHIKSHINVSVRTVAIKYDDARRGEGDQKLDSYESDDGGASWRATNARGMALSGSYAERRMIGKRMVVTRRGRSLRTSKPYPCSVPPGTCEVAETCCGSSCANVAVNPNHCGRCGHFCKSGRACCNGKCRRLATDEKNCGQCGSRCALGTKCLFGLCGY